MISEVLLFVITLIIASYVFKRDRNLPPGPFPIPILGNLPVVYADQCDKLRKKYGNIFMTRFGAVNMLYLADYKISKEAYNKIEFANRVDWDTFKMIKEEIENNECTGINFSNGLRWHNTRRFLLRNLKDLGFGRSKTEDIMLMEIENLVDDFKTLTKEPSILPRSINITVLNVFWQLMSGKRYNYDDSEVKDLLHWIDEFHNGFFTAGIPKFFPILEYIIPARFLHRLTYRYIFITIGEKYTKLVKPIIDEHLANLDPDNPKDLMDEYLIEMKYKKSPESSHFSNHDLIKTTLDLFMAGNETTGSMTRHLIFYMAKFPHIQTKIQKEIDAVVPPGKLPGLEHREKLAYLDATINEVQRHCSLIPFGVLRATNKDVTFQGYHIPRGTVVQSTAELIHMDPVYWENPEEVDPTRFLDSNGKFIAQREGFEPFGIGKRQCLGEQFARMMLFLIMAALLQNFTFSSPEEKEIDITPDKFYIMNKPRKQAVNIKIRH